MGSIRNPDRWAVLGLSTCHPKLQSKQCVLSSTGSTWKLLTSSTDYFNKERVRMRTYARTHAWEGSGGSCPVTASLVVLLACEEARLRLESPSHCWPSLHLPWRPSAPGRG